VDKPDVVESELLAACPSCGMTSATSPHATSEQCIRALEAEIRRLSALLDQVKAKPDFQRSR
jgi:hypothetical protein